MNSLLLTLFVGAFILIGIMLGNFLKKYEKFIDLSIALALSVMTCLLVLDIIPECLELLDSNNGIHSYGILVLGTIIGFILLKGLDFLVPHHEHESAHHHHKLEECHTAHLDHVGVLATVAVVIHNIIEGMTLYVTSISDYKSGLLLAIAIGIHNIPLGIMISSTLKSQKEIVYNTIVLTLSTFIGGLILFIISNKIPDLLIGCLLSVTIGMVIYIVIDELLPHVWKSENKKYCLIGLLLGAIILIGSSFLG